MSAEIRPVVPPMPAKRRGRPPQIGENQTPANSREGRAPKVTQAPEGGIVLHVLEDGLTALGRVWYRGEEIVLDEGQLAATRDENGNSWTDLSDDAQYEKWGTLKFGRGPWPHRGYDIDDPRLTDEEREKLKIAEEKRRQRTAMPRG